MNQNRNIIEWMILEIAADPTVEGTIDMTIEVLKVISEALPRNAKEIRAIQHYLDLATSTLKSCKHQHQKIKQ